MNVYDCFMYFDEDLLLDLRLNILNKYVDKFVITESKYLHSGKEKKLNFDVRNFSKFKDKIIYIQLEEKPSNLIKVNQNDEIGVVKTKQIENALVLENYQRNSISQGLKKFDDDDFILLSDVDEIPNFEDVNFKKLRNKIVLFKQYFFHYKLNLYLKNFYFFGTKGCSKKNLQSPQWLRNVKNKKYPIYRLDILFSDKKYNNVHIVHNGGWHFTNVMSEEKIIYKLKSYLHHADFPENLLNKETFQELIKQKKIMYDHSVDKSGDRFSNRKELSIFENNLLPEYLQKNLKKFKEWLV